MFYLEKLYRKINCLEIYDFSFHKLKIQISDFEKSCDIFTSVRDTLGHYIVFHDTLFSDHCISLFAIWFSYLFISIHIDSQTDFAVPCLKIAFFFKFA